MRILAIIPARYASVRFPAKPLIDMGGKTMVHRVYDQVKKAKGLKHVVVATDHNLIQSEVIRFGGEVMMTSPDHQSGTDRCAEILSCCFSEYDAVINIQGDEPFIHPKQIEQLIELISRPETQIATLVRRIRNNDDVFDPSKVKAVFDRKHRALYFSRNPIPYHQKGDREKWNELTEYFVHVGIYAYKSSVLKDIAQLPPTELEKAESLEQLRWLDNGYTIHVEKTEYESIGIDTPEDLNKIKHLL